MTAQITNIPNQGPSTKYTGFLFDPVDGTYSGTVSGQLGPYVPGVVSFSPSAALLSAASASGPSTFTSNGGNYLFTLGGQFFGATVSLVATFNNVAVTLGSWTGAVVNAPFTIPAGYAVQAVITGANNGGTTSLNANLGGIGAATLNASTASRQPAIGIAGTASPDVLTVQGNPNGTPVPMSRASSTSVVTFQTGTPLTFAASSILIDCSVAGRATFKMIDGTTFGISLGVGVQEFTNKAIVDVVSTSATFTMVAFK